MKPAAGEGQHHPVGLSDPPTDKKPPVGPSSVRSSTSSLERAPLRPAAPSPQQQQEVVVSTAAEVQTKSTAVEEEPAPPVADMRSRLQRLAEERKCWDGGRKHSSQN